MPRLQVDKLRRNTIPSIINNPQETDHSFHSCQPEHSLQFLPTSKACVQLYNPAARMEDSEDHPVQKQADIYKRIKLLGSGSYGRAFLVKEISTGECWVIKQIDLNELSPGEQEAAMKEAKILELLKHHNIVRFKEVYRTAKGKLNIVMEYAEGGDLSHRIKAAKEGGCYFSEEEILSWFVQICLGVKHLHDSKIIHRDLKSQNIFLTSDNLVKIGDFGVAKIMENTVSRAKTLVGSPYYLSPEIVESRPYSFKTDIWSLGTLLFELCALHPPFSATNLQSLALKIVQGNYVQIPKQYSEGLRNLIRWMLQTKQSMRPNINQIFLSQIVATRINKFITASQRLQERSKTAQGFALKPPPNLIALENGENRSEVIMSKYEDKEQVESPVKAKAKTPQIVVKKGPNNFFSRPASGKKKLDSPNDLADLIQIKPSLIEAHQKPERMVVPLPKVPKSTAINYPVKPKHQPIKEKQAPLPKPVNSAFVKKRTSFTQLQGLRKDEVKSAVVMTGRKTEVKKESNPVKEEKQKKKSIVKTPMRKKPSKPPSQTKLQICSQQIKKKELVPLKEKKPQKKKEKTVKRPTTQQIKPKIQQIMQEEKCSTQQDLNSNPSSYDYYNDDFESYSEGSDNEDIDLSFSETLSEDAKNENNFESMLRQLAKINHLIQNGEKSEDGLPMLGQSIPQLLEVSTKPRVDDEELDHNASQAKLSTSQTGINPQEDLQSLRMNLEYIFGVQNIIYAYHKIQEKIMEVGLGLKESETIAEILAGRTEIDEALLTAYFRLIVTIVAAEMRLVD